MKHIIRWMPALVLLLSAHLLSAQAKLDVSKFEEAIRQNGVQVIDVRTPQEFSAGHIQGAKNVDFYSAQFGAEVSKLDKNKPLYVYCAVGGRSASAAGMLIKQGFTKVYDLAGGIESWKRAGKKVTR
jgi:rhodanese-related sulfurtransferase